MGLTGRTDSTMRLQNGDTHPVCGVMKLMWLRSISDNFQAAQFYTCCWEQMVLADSVAGCGSMAEEIQRGGDQILGSTGGRRKEVKELCNTYSHNLHG